MSAGFRFVSACIRGTVSQGCAGPDDEAEAGTGANMRERIGYNVSHHPHSTKRLSTAVMLALAAGAVAATSLSGPVATAPPKPAASADACVPVGAWRTPGESGPRETTTDALVTRALAAGAVLLGETHDNAEHHRWQLQTLTALHARHPDLVIALEMFPRRVQGALDRWIAGELDEQAFLRESEWREVWGHDPALYLPIFHFARMNRIPLVAVNVSRSVTRAVGDKGLAAVPLAEREGVGDPAPALPAYEDMLFESWRDHLPDDAAHGSLDRTERTDRNQPEFRRFLESQLVWDRAIAEGIAEAAARRRGAVVVGLMGSVHVMHGWGVSHQLQALGRPAPFTLLPFERGADCAQLAGGPADRLADAVFGVAKPPRVAAPARPRLGITLGPTSGGVGIVEVANGSIAMRAGLEQGDVILVIAGREPKNAADVAAAVMRQAPGTWLPIEVQRGEQRLEIVARFPAAPAD
jgi:uncharacterized iron-regulated protein